MPLTTRKKEKKMAANYTNTASAGAENNTTFVTPGGVEYFGRNLEFTTVDFGSDVSSKTAKNSTIDLVEKTIQRYANIMGAGSLFSSSNKKTYISEATDAFVGSAASAGGSFTLTTTTGGASVATLQTAIQALGTVDSINLSSATATNKALAI